MIEDQTIERQTDAPVPREANQGRWRSVWLVGGTVVLTVALLFIPQNALERLGNYGYLGVFLLTLVASASIVLPSPALGVALVAGGTLNPWFVGLIGGLAAGLGEITGYLAGSGGSSLAARSRFYPMIERWVQRWGTVTIFVLAFVPGPGLDLAGIAAGAMRMPFAKFLLPCIAGKILRFIAVAWIGRWLLAK